MGQNRAGRRAAGSAQMNGVFMGTWLGVLLAASACGAVACPKTLPVGLSAVTVAESVVVNNLGLSILQVQSKQSAASLLDQLERDWTHAGFAVKRNQAEGWEVLSALSEKCLTTLQLVERSGAFGYLAVNNLAERVVKAPALPMPSGAKVLSIVLSNDNGRQAVTAMIAATQSVNALAEYYTKRLEDEKWASVKAVATTGSDGKFSGVAVSGQRGREHIEVVIVRDEGSKIVINLAMPL